MGTKRIYHINLVGVSSVSDKMGKGSYRGKGKTEAKLGRPSKDVSVSPSKPSSPAAPGKGKGKEQEKKKGSGKP